MRLSMQHNMLTAERTLSSYTAIDGTISACTTFRTLTENTSEDTYQVLLRCGMLEHIATAVANRLITVELGVISTIATHLRNLKG